MQALLAESDKLTSSDAKRSSFPQHFNVRFGGIFDSGRSFYLLAFEAGSDLLDDLSQVGIGGKR